MHTEKAAKNPKKANNRKKQIDNIKFTWVIDGVSYDEPPPEFVAKMAAVFCEVIPELTLKK